MAENKAETPAATAAAPVTSESEVGIDFSGVKALANTAFVPEPWYKTFWNSIVEGLTNVGIFLLGILLDVLKALYAVISGIFIYLYKMVVGLGHAFRKAYRIFREVDGYGKVSFIVQGVGNFHYHQILDGLIFLVLEVAFIAYIAFFGVTNLTNLIFLENGHKASHTNLLNGITSVLVIIGYIIVYVKGIQSMYDGFQIIHAFDFRQAREDQLHVLRNRNHYEAIDFYHTSSRKIRLAMRHEYGYSKLSSLYISYIPFKRIPERTKKSLGINLWMSPSEKLHELAAIEKIYHGYGYNKNAFNDGKPAFVGYLINEEGILRDHANLLYRDYAAAISAGAGNEEKIQAILNDNARNFEYLAAEQVVLADIPGVLNLAKGLEEPALQEKLVAHFKIHEDYAKKLAHAIVKAERKEAHGGAYAYMSLGKLAHHEMNSKLEAVLYPGKSLRAPRYGIAAVTAEIQSGLTKFHHTYDKYNDYLPYTRDTKAELEVLADPKGIIGACFAEDEVSKRNGIKPLPRGCYLDPKDCVSRLVGAYGIGLETAKRLARFTAKQINEETIETSKPCKGIEKKIKRCKDQAKIAQYQKQIEEICQGVKDLPNSLKALETARDNVQKAYDNFIDANRTRRLEGVHAGLEAYNNYAKYRPLYDRGQKAFVSSLTGASLPEHYAETIYQDYRTSIQDCHDDEEKTKAMLAYRGTHFGKLVQMYETYPFHGVPLSPKKQVKQYADEKFAVTVLSLPVIGALLTCIIPLVFSIAIAFTNWDASHKTYTFNWSFNAFKQVLSLSSGGSFSTAFVTLLYWTIIWAFFATFTNYIFGIILALMINKKSIRLKKMWRTLFVITIAIPQFITLLVINLLLADSGAVNKWFETMGWGHFPFLGKVNNSSIDVSTGDYIIPKIFLIVINMWVGIPYTMLSTSGILMNIPDDLYESARIDGASPWTQFWKITMPYVLFVTGPSLLTSFIGNINNFNVIYFLTGGGPQSQDSIGLANAGHTDLLITWLFRITTTEPPNYNIASVIGILVFVICAFFSLIMYKRMGSVQNEEEFQ
jgi:ABC-type sugar transport system permease subunit